MNKLFDKAITVMLGITLLAASSWLVGGKVISAHAGEVASQGGMASNRDANADASKSKVLTEVERKMQTIVTVDFRETPIEDVIKSQISIREKCLEGKT